MRQTLLGIVVGLFVLFLGTEIVTFVFHDWLGLWPNMTQTDALLALIIILLSVALCRLRPIANAAAPPSDKPKVAFPKPAARRKR